MVATSRLTDTHTHAHTFCRYFVRNYGYHKQADRQTDRHTHIHPHPHTHTQWNLLWMYRFVYILNLRVILYWQQEEEYLPSKLILASLYLYNSKHLIQWLTCFHIVSWNYFPEPGKTKIVLLRTGDPQCRHQNGCTLRILLPMVGNSCRFRNYIVQSNPVITKSVYATPRLLCQIVCGTH
jgi:hypothetical protein